MTELKHGKQMAWVPPEEEIAYRRELEEKEWGMNCLSPEDEIYNEAYRLSLKEWKEKETMNENTDGFIIPESDDNSDIPSIPMRIACKKCSGDAVVFRSDSNRWVDYQGYLRHRIRIHVKCQKCGERAFYRLGGLVIKDGKHVLGETEGPKAKEYA